MPTPPVHEQTSTGSSSHHSDHEKSDETWAHRGRSSQSSDGSPGALGLVLPARVGRFYLEREIAHGGMGVVVSARDPGFARTVALKILLSCHENDADTTLRFLREAQIMGQMQHPGIPPVYERGELPDGRPYLSMKLIQGKTLGQLLDQRARAEEGIEQWIDVFESICQTLGYVHSQGILHRDLKPSNIMVEAFGEVQVMDWGLAKMVGADEPAPSTDTPIDPTPIDLTSHGSILGSPAYIAPEQARGEIETLDPRCDVFGLGAILCEILTGSPPFDAETRDENYLRAREGNVDLAVGRLERCKADPQLIDLAKRCLAPSPDDRPKHAGEVAELVQRYQTSVGERLQRAEIDRAQLETKAAEERKRGKLILLFSVLTGFFLVTVSFAVVWYLQDRSERRAGEAQQRLEQSTRKELLERRIQTALDEADLERAQQLRTLRDPLMVQKYLSTPELWASRLARIESAWKQAEGLAKGSEHLLEPQLHQRIRKMGQELEEYRADLEWGQELDKVRMDSTRPVGGRFVPDLAEPHYRRSFRKRGLDFTSKRAEVLAEFIRNSPLRFVLIAAIDHWVLLGEAYRPQTKLLRVAALADVPDPWRERYRRADQWTDPSHLRELETTLDPTRQTQHLMVALSRRFELAGVDAVPFLRRARLHHPRDFWLAFRLAVLTTDIHEKIAILQVAEALRPHSALVHASLAFHLFRQQRLEEAETHYRQAIESMSDAGNLYRELAETLEARGKRKEAADYLEKAVQANPQDAVAYERLGLVYASLKRYPEAINSLRTSFQLFADKPNSNKELSSVQNNLGYTFFEMQQYEEAVKEFEEAIHLNPLDPLPYVNLSTTLRTQNKLEEAVTVLKKAVEKLPNEKSPRTKLAETLLDLERFDEVIEQYRALTQLEPDNASIWNNLGTTLQRQGELQEAIACFRKAIALESAFALAHINLGIALMSAGSPDESIQHFREGIRLDPNHRRRYYEIGNIYLDQRRYEEAIVAYREATTFSPAFAEAHCNWGHALMRLGRLREALPKFQEGDRFGRRHPTWSYPSHEWVATCQLGVDLEQRLTDCAIQATKSKRLVQKNLDALLDTLGKTVNSR